MKKELWAVSFPPSVSFYFNAPILSHEKRDRVRGWDQEGSTSLSTATSLPMRPAWPASDQLSVASHVLHIRYSVLATSPGGGGLWFRDSLLTLPLQGPVISNPGGGVGARGNVSTEGTCEYRLHNWTVMLPS